MARRSSSAARPPPSSPLDTVPAPCGAAAAPPPAPSAYFWFGRGDGEDYAYSSSGKDTVFLWNVSDIRAVHVTRDAEAESLLRQAGGADAQYTQVTVGSDTLTVSSTGGRPDLMLASGATYRVTERGSGVSLTRIR